MKNYYSRKALYIKAIRESALLYDDGKYLEALVSNTRPEDEPYVQQRCIDSGVNLHDVYAVLQYDEVET